jgi:hypothetical protein
MCILEEWRAMERPDNMSFSHGEASVCNRCQLVAGANSNISLLIHGLSR